MPNTRNFNRSFAGGEISPEMFGRIDADKYQTGAAKMLNMIARPQGPAQNRPGFEYVGAVKNSAHKSRLVRFVYSVDDSVVVELGEQYIRFYKNGGPIQVSTLPALQRNTVTFTNTLTTISWIGHQLVAGDRIKFATSAAGFIAGTTYYVVSPSTNVIQLSLSDGGSAIAANANTTATAGKVYSLSDTVSYSGYNYYAKGEVNSAVALPIAGGSPASSAEWHYMPGSFYEIPSPYSAVDLFGITYTQSNDVMTFTHPSYSIRELRRYAETDWELVGVNLEASLVPPSTVVGYGKHSGRVKILAIESLAFNTLNGSDVARVVFSGSAALAVADLVYVSGTGIQKFDNRLFTIRTRTESGGNTYVELSSFETGTRQDLEFDLAANVSTDRFTGVELDNNTPLTFPAFVSVTGISSATTYYVIDSTSNNFKVSTSIGGVAVNLTGANGTVRYQVFPTAAYVQVVYESTAFDNSYAVTTVAEDLSESGVSDSVPIKNNIFAAQSFNLIVVDPVDGFFRHNIYKLQSGIYGYIGAIEPYDQESVTGITLDGASINARSARFASPSFQFNDYDPVVFTSSNPPTGFTAGVTYFVKRIVDGVGTGYFNLLANLDDEEGVATTAAGTSPYTLRRKYFFKDDNIAPDMGQTPPKRDVDELALADDYPRAVCYFEQRRCFAGSNNDPQTIWMTKSGTENDLSYSFPSKDDDRIKVQASSRERNTIKHLVSMQNLIALTNAAEWRLTSINSDAITPSSVSIRPQSFIGANSVTPQLVNNNLVFCAARGGHVRELGYNFNAQSFVTGDLSLRATHLFDSYELVDMCHSKSPLPILWFVSTSGKLLGLTYVPEEQLTAWHQHETDGVFESCVSIPEGEEDRLYVVVKRNVDGADRRYIERLSTIEVPDDIVDAVYLDSSVTQSNVVPFTVVEGLAHLNGETVSVFADGKVQPSKVVSGGQITLSQQANTAHVGLPYVSDLQTLPVTLQVDGFGQGRNYNVNKTWLRVHQTAGVKVGPDESRLVAANPYSTTPELAESTIEVMVSPSWQNDGQVYIRQSEPLPMTVVGLTFEVSVGG
jgi:hypothetical protein